MEARGPTDLEALLEDRKQRRVSFLHQPLAHTQFCIKNRAIGGSAYRIVAEQHKFVAQNRAAS
ncbi:MAG TPA: hypothetical protein VF974_01270 [Patescibacteria group bacterium]